MRSSQPSTWDLKGLSRDLATGRLFELLADLEQVQDKEVWKRLWLVPTCQLERWMFREGVALFHAHLRAGDPTYWPLVQLLLQRHLLNLAVRRRPGSLIKFCQRLPLTAATDIADLWKRADLPAAMAPPTIRDQEAAFAARLLWVAERLEPMLPWAASLVRKVADGRTPAFSETDGPCVRVVFASTGDGSLRHGALVRFVLLAERDGDGPLVHDEAVFDANFRGALDAAMARVERFRVMYHEWGFLPAASLCDTSGFLAVRIAQSLANAVGGTECFGLPSWLVVSASLADDGSGVTPAGHLHRKCAHLIEEGVRVLLVIDEKGRSNVPMNSARAEGVDLPGADDLWIVRCRSYDEAMSQLRERDWIWPVQAPGVRRPFASIDLSRIGVRMPQQSAASDYQPPKWFLEQILKAMGSLKGRGYIHVEAPAAWGKSELAMFLKKPSDDSRRFGTVLRFRVLHGVFETAELFLHQVCQQCQRAVPDDVLLPVFNPADIRDFTDARRRLAELLRRTMESCDTGRVLLVLDGLDELTDTRGKELLNILPAPEDLANGCFILLLSRPKVRSGIADEMGRFWGAADLFVTLSLNVNDAQYLELRKNFAQERLAQGATAGQIDLLLARALNFLHLRLLCELEKNKDLSHVLPDSDISHVFAEYLDRVAKKVQGGDTAFRTWHWAVLRCAAAAGTVCRADLRRMLDRDWNNEARDMLDRTLDELVDNALLIAESRTDLPDDTLYSIIHEDIANWLRKRDEPNGSMNSRA